MATLRFSFGTMGSGKSTLALQIHHNLSSRGMHGLLCTHLDREGAQVSSRLGVAVEAVDVGPKLDLFELARQHRDHHGVLHYLVCDEAQFYAPEQADQLARVVDELGAAFWNATPLAPAELAWARQADGSYRFSAVAGTDVAEVTYLVDGYTLGTAPADDPKTPELETQFPLAYTFKNATSERFVEALGFDAEGVQVARSIGLLDVTPNTSVFIRQTGEDTYEVGLERAPAEVAAVELRVDGYLVKDGLSGETHVARGAVLATYSTLGEREFELRTFNANGTLRGTLRRTFTLE